MSKLLHWLGFHDRNWQPYWFLGNIWVKCAVCGYSRQLTAEEALRIPDSEIEKSLPDIQGRLTRQL